WRMVRSGRTSWRWALTWRRESVRVAIAASWEDEGRQLPSSSQGAAVFPSPPEVLATQRLAPKSKSFRPVPFCVLSLLRPDPYGPPLCPSNPTLRFVRVALKEGQWQAPSHPLPISLALSFDDPGYEAVHLFWVPGNEFPECF